MTEMGYNILVTYSDRKKVNAPVRRARSILFRRFPQFNSVTIGIHDPGKPSVIGVLAMRINLDSCLLQFLKQPVQIIHTN